MDPSLSRKSLDFYQRRFHLLDWRIRGREVEGVPDDGHLGDVDLEIDYRTATITIYPDAIANSRDTNSWDVVVHEFGEIIAAQACVVLPGKIYDSEAMVRVRDRFAEHFALIMEAWEQA